MTDGGVDRYGRSLGPIKGPVRKEQSVVDEFDRMVKEGDRRLAEGQVPILDVGGFVKVVGDAFAEAREADAALAAQRQFGDEYLTRREIELVAKYGRRAVR